MSNYKETIKPEIKTRMVITHKLVEGIICQRCGKIHDVESESYRVVYGDITVGLNGGIVGGSIDEHGQVYRSFAYCTDCLIEIINLNY